MKATLDLRERQRQQINQNTAKYIPRLVKNCSVNELIPILPEFSKIGWECYLLWLREAYDGLVDYEL